MKKLINKILKIIRNPMKIFPALGSRYMLKWIPDSIYLKLNYRGLMGEKLNLEHPKKFNEKLQWLKLYNKKPEYTLMVDKYEAKQYVSKIIGKKYIIPTIGVWDRFEDINFNLLPKKFVIKCTHDSGGLVIVKDKNKIDIDVIRKKIKKSLKKNYFWPGREWVYKNIKPRIIIEEYKTDKDEKCDLTDYKYFCFNGLVDCVMISIERSTGKPKYYFFDKNWNLLRLNIRGKEAPKDFTLPKPRCIEEMFKIASLLSKGIPFLRVDLYESNERVFFGELTFFPQSGFDNLITYEAEKRFGHLISIPKDNNTGRSM